MNSSAQLNVWNYLFMCLFVLVVYTFVRIEKMLIFTKLSCDSSDTAPLSFLCQFVCAVRASGLCGCVCLLGCARVWRFQFAIIFDSTSLIPTEGRVVGRRELLLLHTRQADYLSTGLKPRKSPQFLFIYFLFVCLDVGCIYMNQPQRGKYICGNPMHPILKYWTLLSIHSLST